jgi:hypothetical protein
MKIYFFGSGTKIFNSNAKEIKYPYQLFPNSARHSLFAALPSGHINRNFIIQHNGKKYRPHAPKRLNKNIPQKFKNINPRPYGSLYELELEPVSSNTRVSGPIPKSFNNNWNKKNTSNNARKRVNEILYLTFQKYKAGMSEMRNNNLNNLKNAYNIRWRKHVMDKWFKSNNVLKGPPKPLYRGVVYKSFINKNGKYTNKAYSSWTTNLNVAKSYALKNGNGYVLVLKNKNNRPYVKYNTSRPTFARNTESEIILGPGNFKVNNIMHVVPFQNK